MLIAVYSGGCGIIFHSIHNKAGIFSERFFNRFGVGTTEQTNCLFVLGFYNYRSFHAITLGDRVYGLNA
jgi:hypothetical protein